MEHDSVSLPGMGCFTVVETPSELLNEGRMITPPLKKIVFDSSDSIQDNLLIQQYARLKNIPEKEASAEVADLLRQMKKELVDNAKVVIPDFGALCFGASGSFVFEAAAEFDFESDSYCLETLLLQKRSEIGDIEVVDDDVAENIQAEPVELDGTEEAADSMFESVEVEETAEVEEIAKIEGTIEIEETVAEEEVKKIEDTEEIADAGDVEKNGGAGKLLIWFGIVVGLFILLVIVIFLFKDALMPVLEQLLYSEEELEILKLSTPSL